MYGLGWIKDEPDDRDLPYSAVKHQEFKGDVPKSVDLRPRMPKVFNQLVLGSCTAQGIGAALAYLRNNDANLDDWIPSRLFIYFHEREMEGYINQDRGACIRTGIKVVSQYGAPPEDFWPYDVEKWAMNPPELVDIEAHKYKALDYYRVNWSDINEVLHCLAAGFPIVFGFKVYPHFMSEDCAKTGILKMPNTKRERADGGHCVLLVGYDLEKELFLVRNSWGEEWGQGGYFWMPFDYVTDPELSDDFWTIRATS